AHAVDVRGAGVGQHAAGHVVHLGVGVGGGLNGPCISSRIIFKRVSEFAAGIRAAPAHSVKLSVGWEKDPNYPDSYTWEVRTGWPKTLCRPFYCVIPREGRVRIAEYIGDRPRGNARRHAPPELDIEREPGSHVVVHGLDS